MENKYLIRKENIRENVYDEDGVVIGTDIFEKYVVYDTKTETPQANFDYEWDAIEWCIVNDQDGRYQH